MRRRNFPTLAAAAMAMSAGAVVGMSGRAQAGTVVVAGNSISGVDGVVYAGVLYDVSFFSGSFAQTYTTASRPLPFSGANAVTAAVQTLFTTVNLGAFVLQNGVSLGDGGPNASPYSAISFLTPSAYDTSLGTVVYQGAYITVSPSLATGAPALNIAGSSTQQFVGGFINVDQTTLNGSPVEYAIWTAQVPEPDSAALLGTGLVAAAASVVGRRKRRRA